MTQSLGTVVAVTGAHVRVRLDDTATDAGAAAIQAMVRIRSRYALVYALVRELQVVSDPAQPGGEARMAELDLMGECPAQADGSPGPFRHGVARFPALGDPVEPADGDDLAMVYLPSADSRITVGTLDREGRLPACLLSDDLLSNHFAVLGTTGSGKSCSVTVLLRAMLADHPQGHVVLLDPHDEYGQAFGDQAVRLRPDRMSLPYWLLNFAEMVGLFCSPEPELRATERDLLKRAVLAAKHAYAGEEGRPPITVDTPVPFRLSTVIETLDRAMGELDKPSDSLPYRRVKARIETLRNDRRFAFMFGGVAVQDTMAEVLAQLLRIPVDGKPITVVDLSAVPMDIVDAIVSLLARLIFDFAVWSRPEDRVPVLLVCEEAHRYIPADTSGGFGPTRDALARIAKEGRKYGIGLGLVTQRPSELSESILAQCGTLFALRMTNEHDQHFVRRALPEGADALFNALPALSTGEAVVVGAGTTAPMRLRFHELPAAARPQSGTVSFAGAWAAASGSREQVEQAIARWRRHGRTADRPADDPARVNLRRR